MTAEMKIYSSRDEWLAARTSCIGGSEASAVIGQNPWMTNQELWRVKAGVERRRFVTNDAIEYGNRMEAPIREIFKGKHPELSVQYAENNMWTNEVYPFAHASLDSWYYREDGQMGVLEIKTGNIKSRTAWQKWDGQVPQQYYIQVLHYMAVTESAEAILIALLKGNKEDEDIIRQYRFSRNDIGTESDLCYLMNQERIFADSIQAGKMPDLILPDL